MKQVTSILAALAMSAFGISCSQNPESNDSRSGLSSSDDFLAEDGKRYPTVLSLDDIDEAECDGPEDLGAWIRYVQNLDILVTCKYVYDADGEVSYEIGEIDLSGKDGADGKDGEDGKDGKDGDKGDKGEDGKNGANSIISQYHLEPGDDNCPEGGTHFVSCLDIDANLQCTQDDENIQMTYICANDADVDADNDGIKDWADNCLDTANADQADADGDNVGDVCDNAPNTFNPDQADTDSDGVADAVDNCKRYPNADQTDANGNGRGDICDPFLVSMNIIKLLTTGACTDCNLRGVTFSTVSFGHLADVLDAPIDLSGSNLTRAVFSGSELNGASFVGAGINYADFSDASLVSADFTDAIYNDDTNFDGADLTDAIGLD